MAEENPSQLSSEWVGGQLLVDDKAQECIRFSWLSHRRLALTVLQHRAFKETSVIHTLGLPNPLNC